MTFVDNETKQSRPSGNLVIKTEVNPSTNRNNVYICYSDGTNEWKIALGASNLVNKVTIENPSVNGLDVSDSRFQQFGYMLRSIVNNWAMVQMMNHQTSLMMYNFNAIKEKLGISNKHFSGKDNGNYADSSYRSSAPDAASDNSEFGNDMPF